MSSEQPRISHSKSGSKVPLIKVPPLNLSKLSNEFAEPKKAKALKSIESKKYQIRQKQQKSIKKIHNKSASIGFSDIPTPMKQNTPKILDKENFSDYSPDLKEYDKHYSACKPLVEMSNQKNPETENRPLSLCGATPFEERVLNTSS